MTRLLLMTLCSFLVLSAPRASESEMQSFSIGDEYGTYFEFFRASRISIWRSSKLWATALVRVEDGKCREISTLFGFGDSREKISKAYERAVIDEPCTASIDQNGIRDLPTYAFIAIGSGGRSETGWVQEGDRGRKAKKNWVRITSDLWASDAIDSAAEACEGLCEFSSLLALMFAKADFFDRVDRALTASLWRVLALEGAIRHKNIRLEGKDVLKRHIYRHYQHAVQTADFPLATEAMEMADDLRFDDPDYEKIKAHFSRWEEIQATATNGLVVPLVADTPFSDLHHVAARSISNPEFRITVTQGSVSHAFLLCGQGWQVSLSTDQRSGWKIPDGVDDCSIMVFGGEGTIIHLWEYPEGTLDDNGNLSA